MVKNQPTSHASNSRWPDRKVTQGFHRTNSSAIHIGSGSNIPSGINRSQFEKWKKDYWKNRANTF
ncbi:HNH/ENDO VII family nuclease [Pseudomonas syringae]|uniref:HNH/ENDO VII family nuclease n=1 Tax=Pseudomonas syringae TaxID=317 RepID=UPI0034D559E1